MEGFRARTTCRYRATLNPDAGQALALVPLVKPMTAAGIDCLRAYADALAGGGDSGVREAGFRCGVAGAAMDAGAGDERRHPRGGLSPREQVERRIAGTVAADDARAMVVALRRDWTWRASLPGAALATVLWFASTLSFGFMLPVCELWTRLNRWARRLR